jgi:hypothetical protein
MTHHLIGLGRLVYLLCFIHLSIRLSLILEYRVPSYSITPSANLPLHGIKRCKMGFLQHTKGCWSSRWHDFPLRPPLEDQWFLRWSQRESERADCLGGFIVVCREEIVEAFMAEGIEEPFSVSSGRGRSQQKLRCEGPLQGIMALVKSRVGR